MIGVTDLSYLFHQVKSVVSAGYNKGKEPNPNILGNSKDEALFVRKLSTDLSFQVNKLIPRIDHLFVCMDNGTWREDFYEPYKKNRIKDPNATFDWKRFYEIQEHFASILSAHGASILKRPKAEADDLVFAVTHYAAKQGDSSVMLTSDRDLYQSISANLGEGAVVLINTNSLTRKLVFPPSFKQWVNDNDGEDIFNMSMDKTDSDIMRELYNSLEKMELNRDFHVFSKIIQGDDGDNVPALWYWKNDKGETVRTTPKHTKYLWEKLAVNETFNSESLLLDENLFDQFHKNLELATKQIIDKVEVKRRYTENRTLMELDEKIIPKEIYDYVIEEYGKRQFLQKFDQRSLVKGTPWEKNIEMTIDLFKDLKVDDDNGIIITEKKTNELF